jgi:holo-[acyl-carrier protein] synthase
MLRTGVDLIEIARIDALLARHGDRFLARVFTPGERDDCHGRAESLAARFAAKEAVAKALGTGIWRHGVAWTDIEVRRGAGGEPHLVLHRAAAVQADRLRIAHWSLSLSHTHTQAVAFVVALAAG